MTGVGSSQVTLDVPEEILVDILKFVDAKTLVRCRAVCKLWKYLIDNEVWREKARIGCYRSLRNISSERKLPKYLYYYICSRDPFEKNLLKNNCGQGAIHNILIPEKLKHWTILSSGGNRWKVENPPAGADPLPQAEEFGNCSCCFATSYHSCTKQQKVDLWTTLPGKVLDDLQPVIEVSDWYAGRFDCGCVYDIQATLLNANQEHMNNFQRRETVEQWQGGAWSKVSHQFENYGPGLRYVIFYHGGMDTQFWAGHYGSKMSGACVKLLIPPLNTIEHSCSSNSISSNDSELQ